MIKTLVDLFKALINATLLLLALCLFLGLKLTTSVEAVTANLANIADQVRPLKSELTTINSEIQQLRSGLSARPEPEIIAELKRLEMQLGRIESQIAALADLPQDAIRTAAEAAAAKLAGEITEMLQMLMATRTEAGAAASE